MRLFIVAVGRLKKGPEQELVKRYADRIKKAGKSVGLSAIETVELVESRASDSNTRKFQEAQEIKSRLPDNTVIWVFDERGKNPRSQEFAKSLEKGLDQGTSNLALVIGGPDGLDKTFREDAHQILSFGAMTLPHQLVRVLVHEQIYRAITIMTNHPYHRV